VLVLPCVICLPYLTILDHLFQSQLPISSASTDCSNGTRILSWNAYRTIYGPYSSAIVFENLLIKDRQQGNASKYQEWSLRSRRERSEKNRLWDIASLVSESRGTVLFAFSLTNPSEQLTNNDSTYSFTAKVKSAAPLTICVEITSDFGAQQIWLLGEQLERSWIHELRALVYCCCLWLQILGIGGDSWVFESRQRKL